MLTTLTLENSKGFPGYIALIPTICAGLILWSGEKALANKGFLSLEALIIIGKISYPLYLWHWLVLAYLNITQGENLGIHLKLSILILSTLLSWITYRFIEKVYRFGNKPTLNALTLSISIALIGLAGYMTYINNGFSEYRYGTKSLIKFFGRLDCKELMIDGFCVFGNPNAEKNIVLYGDSHAQMLSGPLHDKLSKEYKVIYLSNGGCFAGEKYEGNKTDKETCAKVFEKMNSLRGEHIYATIKDENWDAYVPNNEKAITDSIQDSFSVYGINPYKIIIIGPTGSVDLDCLISDYYSRNIIGKQCNHAALNLSFNQSFKRISEKVIGPNNIYFVYPFDYFCSNEKCNPIVNRTSYYWDDNHLSYDGASIIVDRIIDILKD